MPLAQVLDTCFNVFVMAEDAQPSAREEQARRLAGTLRRQLGPTLCGLMQAPDLVELMLNPNGRVWVDRLGREMEPVSRMAATTIKPTLTFLFDLFPLDITATANTSAIHMNHPTNSSNIGRASDTSTIL
jgi:hypothetical protein